nr:Biomphalaria glabrata Golgi apparatus protein 1-like [Biomphalaria glabrata]
MFFCGYQTFILDINDFLKFFRCSGNNYNDITQTSSWTAEKGSGQDSNPGTLGQKSGAYKTGSDSPHQQKQK